MELTADLAELTGVIIGDGCLSEYISSWDNRQRKVIAFTGNNDELGYYQNFVRPTFKKYFRLKGTLYIRKDDQSTRYFVYGKKAFYFFTSLGVPIGEKTHIASIPPVFFTNNSFLISVLRGLWDTDGSVYRRYSKKYNRHPKIYCNLLVLQIKFVSKTLIHGVKDALSVLGIKSNKITKSNESYVLRITRQKEIKKFLALVGFRNPHHLNRLSSFGVISQFSNTMLLKPLS